MDMHMPILYATSHLDLHMGTLEYNPFSCQVVLPWFGYVSRQGGEMGLQILKLGDPGGQGGQIGGIPAT